MKRILLIEDQPSERVFLQRLLKACQATFSGEVEMIEAVTWEAGMEVLTKADVDVVLLDLSLDRGPQDTMAKLRQWHKQLPPVVILTGLGDEEFRRECISSGAWFFIEKAPSPDGQMNISGVFNACYNAYLWNLYHGTSKV